jgi:acyl carrier protein
VLNIDVKDDISQDTCVEWDSLRHLNIIFELETGFDISIEPEEMAIMNNINTIENIIKTKL